MRDIDVLVIGGGISGLSVANSLRHRNVSVEVWESSARPGGKIQSDKNRQGYLTERAATMVANFRPEVSRFMEQSNLIASKALLTPALRRYVIHDDKLVAVPTKLLAMVNSPVWSLAGKLRLLAEPFVPKGGHEDETVSEFICRRVGNEVLVNAMEPYVSGVLASNPDLANAYTVLPRMTSLEKRFGSLTLGILVNKLLRRRTAMSQEVFSFAGGMFTLVQSLLNDPVIRFRPNHKAIELAKHAAGWRVTGNVSGTEVSVRARHVVLSVPTQAAARLLEPLDRDLSTLLRGIQYAPLTVVHTGFDRQSIDHPLDGTGFLLPRRSGSPVTGCLWMSSLFSDRTPTGKVLFTSYLGGARCPEALEWDDDRSIGEVMRVIKPLLNIRDEAPDMVRLDRVRNALPLYHGNYYRRMKMLADHLQKLSGLHLEGNYRGGISVRDRIACADVAARRIAAELAQSGRSSRLPFSLVPFGSQFADQQRFSKSRYCSISKRNRLRKPFVS